MMGRLRTKRSMEASAVKEEWQSGNDAPHVIQKGPEDVGGDQLKIKRVACPENGPEGNPLLSRIICYSTIRTRHFESVRPCPCRLSNSLYPPVARIFLHYSTRHDY